MRIIGKNVLNRIARGETAEDMLDRDPGAGDDRLSHHDLGVAPDAWMAHVLGSMDGKDSTIRAAGRGRFGWPHVAGAPDSYLESRVGGWRAALPGRASKRSHGP